MLVDATHQEETRIVVTGGNQLEEFDFESASKVQLRGNIYLAKVTRVEPSLQACFVDYGGNRHGFLAFSEIHPDYYQIPVADKEALLAAEKQQALEAEQENQENIEELEENENGEATQGDAPDDETSKNGEIDEQEGQEEDQEDNDQTVDQLGGDDALEEEVERKKPRIKRYKIQEVIKRRQVMLVQVVKEERGNKGAALTSYLSLAGRYSVLMPNTARGGGISRKITNSSDRKRLKEIAGSLAVPEGMGVILRTAGASRTKAEVKRDFEYLMRLWESVRSLTLTSTAPCLVYEEGSLIKRTIRDLYSKEIDELLVSGEEAHIEAKEFMEMIMPSHVKKVRLYRGDKPIFSKYNVEVQLDSMFSPQVTLPSGGYIVINPTEALVSIDVNSGKATKERNIEATALQTNLEAAHEIARQLRLRDMAGLVVIDFIDMMDKRSIRNVENKMKESLRNDRARIQIGRISLFGLLEMSRQRMRFGVLESSTNVCPTCAGAGIVRSVESLALMIVRAIEDYVQRKPNNSINVNVPTDVANFILNAKREALSSLEKKNNISISVLADIAMVGNNFEISKGEKRQVAPQAVSHIKVDSADIEKIEIEEGEEDVASNEKRPPRKRKRRGSRRPHENHANQENHAKQENNAKQENSGKQENQDKPEVDNKTNNDNASVSESTTTPQASENADEPRKPRRRGRRGGRRNNQTSNEHSSAENKQSAKQNDKANTKPDATLSDKPSDKASDNSSQEQAVSSAKSEPANVSKNKETKTSKAKVSKPKPSKAKPSKQSQKPSKHSNVEETQKDTPSKSKAKSKPPTKVEDKKKTKPVKSKTKPNAEEIVVTSSKSKEKAEDKQPKKGGWWQRNIFG